MNRTLRKTFRDLVVSNTLGQILILILEFLPEIGEVYDIAPGTVAAITTTLTLSLAIYRVVRENWDALANVDSVG